MLLCTLLLAVESLFVHIESGWWQVCLGNWWRILVFPEREVLLTAAQCFVLPENALLILDKIFDQLLRPLNSLGRLLEELRKVFHVMAQCQAVTLVGEEYFWNAPTVVQKHLLRWALSKAFRFLIPRWTFIWGAIKAVWVLDLWKNYLAVWLIV